MAAKTKSEAMREAFEQFAGEERGHRAKLTAIKEGKRQFGDRKQILDLKLSDYLVDQQPSPDMNYQSILIMCMKKEKAAFRLYSDLAAQTEDLALKDLLLGLAQEEAKHKLRFEIEYDDQILAEN